MDLQQTGDGVPLAVFTHDDIEEMLGWHLNQYEMGLLQRFYDEDQGAFIMERGAALNLILLLRKN